MVAAQLIGSALEKICDAASGRKYASLRQETKVRRVEVLVSGSVVGAGTRCKLTHKEAYYIILS